MAKHHDPVGKAQKIILEALGRTDIETFDAAESFFDSIGIVVVPKRVGRASVPRVFLKEPHYEYGDDNATAFEPSIDLTPLAAWMEEK